MFQCLPQATQNLHLRVVLLGHENATVDCRLQMFEAGTCWHNVLSKNASLRASEQFTHKLVKEVSKPVTQPRLFLKSCVQACPAATARCQRLVFEVHRRTQPHLNLDEGLKNHGRNKRRKKDEKRRTETRTA